MAITERLLSMLGQWAKKAHTNIPMPPVPGVAYRNDSLDKELFEEGQAYDKVYDSSRYNQLDYMTTGLLQSVEQYGMLPWSHLTNYAEWGLCLGLDGYIYQAVKPSGPNHGGAQPTDNEEFWGPPFIKGLDDDGEETIHTLITKAPLTGGGPMDRDLTLSLDTTSLVETTRSINTTAPLAGGGPLTDDLTLTINATPNPTANHVILRDAAGRAKVAAPAAADDIARKAEVDAVRSSSVQWSNFTQSFGHNGWQRLPSGLIMQWGVIGSVGVHTTTWVNFTIAFPNACLTASIRANLDAGHTHADWDSQIVGYPYTTGLNFFSQVYSSAMGYTPQRYFWFAIGY